MMVSANHIRKQIAYRSRYAKKNMRFKHFSTPVETDLGLPNTLSSRVAVVHNEKTGKVVISTDLVYKHHNIPQHRRNEKRDLGNPEWVEKAKKSFKRY